MRVVMFSGKGGVGTTTAAAGTATVGALRGLRSLVVSLGSGTALADAFDIQVGGEPVEVDDRLWAQQLDGQELWATAVRLAAVDGDPGDQTDPTGQTDHTDPTGRTDLGDQADPAAASTRAALTALGHLGAALPDAATTAILLAFHAQVRSGRWDVVVVDAGSAVDLPRLLRLPSAARAWVRRTQTEGGSVWPRQLTGPVATLDTALLDLQALLTAPETTARLVLTPESVPLAEARRTFSALGQQRLRVDGVLANRVFPWGGSDGWRRQWVAAQAAVVADAERAFAPVPVFCAAYRTGEPVGVEELAAFAAEAYGAADPFAPGIDEVPAAR